MDPREQLVLVIDFGAQYSQLIARRVRECQVYCELWPSTRSVEEILARRPRGIILSGGPASVYGEGAPRLDPRLYDSGIPILGICYGMQLMAHQLGGRVVPAPKREYGRTEMEVLAEGGLFNGLVEPEEGRRRLLVWMSHGDLVEEAPPGFVVLARTADTPIAAMRHRQRPLWAVQFHPEVHHTPQGLAILRNFLYEQCGCQPSWTPGHFIDAAVEEIRARVGQGAAICGLSGGVDSATAAVLVHRAIGDRLTCIYVDHGFMRKGETEQVVATFREKLGMRLVHVDARERFLSRLDGVADPERKRKLIGEEFIRVFEEEAAKVGDVRYLVQGTLYPDVIESGVGVGGAAVIKSHHNVGGLPERMRLELVEPLRLLFKDEVRAVAEQLGLPEEIVWRQPFPGPGLAIRVMGPVSRERVELVREADHIVVDEIRRAGLYRQVWQSFAVLTETRSVGVMGDDRTYGYVVAVRAVGSTDGMTADWYRLPHDVLERIAARIIREVPAVNRVVYDITSKPPGTIEWE